MHRLTYTTPLLLSMLVLAACPGDPVPATTETDTDTGSSTGDSSDGPTTIPPTTTETTVDPDSTTTGEPMMCEPACDPGQCCVGGNCFDEPDPSCAGGCGEFEICDYPAGADRCDPETVAECMVCGTEGSYDSCLDMECPAGSFCVQDDPDAPTLAWCAEQGCGTDDCACPLPAAGSNSTPACGEFAGDDGRGSCFLDCSDDAKGCPTDMICRNVEGENACVWPGDDIVSSCCTSNPGTTGCDDAACEMAVCDADAYCCDTEWDQICADAVPGFCPGLCPIENPEPQYGDCINGGPCDAGLVCVSDGGMTFGWCATIDCVDDMVCQPPPGTGDAPAVCAPINDMTDACLLDCSMDQTCPDGMTCFNSQFCVWELIVPPPPTLPGYGDCADNPAITCQPGEDVCLTDAGGTAAACSQSGCAMAADCAADLPPTGNALAACGDLGGGLTCYLDCAGGETCADGTVCTPVGMGMACLWPDDGFLLDEDFELGAFRPGWSVIDVDGLTPDANVAFVDQAYVVSDLVEPGANFAAYSTSWYAPAGQSDDWLVSPQITLGAASVLTWEGLAPDMDFADGYEVYVSTGGPTVPEFMANATVFSVVDEAQMFAPHMVDLAAAGYMNQDVYIAWRNNSNDEFLLLIDNVQVTQ